MLPQHGHYSMMADLKCPARTLPGHMKHFLRLHVPMSAPVSYVPKYLAYRYPEGQVTAKSVE